MIKCVMFDLGNVIARFDTLKFISVIDEHRTKNVDPLELLTGKFIHFVRDFEVDALHEFDFYKAICKAYGLEGLNFDGFCSLLSAILRPDPKILNLMMRLKQNKLNLVLVTNISRYHLLYLQRAYPEFMRGFIEISASCELGIRKPCLEMWLRPMKKLDFEADECLVVDDQLPNVEAFRKLGGFGFHYDVVNDQLVTDKRKLTAVRKNLLATCHHLGLIQ